MSRHHRTPFSRLAAATTLVVAALLVPTLAATTHVSLLVVEGAALVAAVAAALGMWLTNSFESRLFATLVSLNVTAGTVLNLTMGIPGAPAGADLTPGRALLLALCLLAPALIALDARTRQARQRSARRPYAL